MFETYESLVEKVKTMYEINDESSFKLMYNEDDEKYPLDSQIQFDHIKKTNKSLKRRALKFYYYGPNERENQNKSLDLSVQSLPTIYNDPILKQYTEFLRKKIIAPNEVFDSKFTKDTIPCKACLGTGRLEDRRQKSIKCKKCNGFGDRPKEDKWVLIQMFIEMMFRKLLLSPLDKFFNDTAGLEEAICGISKEESLILDLDTSHIKKNTSKNIEKKTVDFKQHIQKETNKKNQVIIFFLIISQISEIKVHQKNKPQQPLRKSTITSLQQIIKSL